MAFLERVSSFAHHGGPRVEPPTCDGLYLRLKVKDDPWHVSGPMKQYMGLTVYTNSRTYDDDARDNLVILELAGNLYAWTWMETKYLEPATPRKFSVFEKVRVNESGPRHFVGKIVQIETVHDAAAGFSVYGITGGGRIGSVREDDLETIDQYAVPPYPT